MPGESNALPVQFLAPRISVIVALSSRGELFMTLTQSNSNSSMMSVYFHHLAAKLDARDKNWREKTIFLMDNASYHRSA